MLIEKAGFFIVASCDKNLSLKGSNVMPADAEIASAFATIRYCCGTVGGAGLLHLGGLEEIESSVMDIMTCKKRQVQLTAFLCPK